MDYSTMLKNALSQKSMSLQQLCFQLAKRDIWLDKSVLSKIQNKKLPPAKDEHNIALADILGIDQIQFRLAAVRERIPSELYDLIKEVG